MYRPSLLSHAPLRSDVICEFPLKEMLAFHKERGAEGTLLVTKVLAPAQIIYDKPRFDSTEDLRARCWSPRCWFSSNRGCRPGSW